MRIAIVGSRDYPELEEVWNVVEGLAQGEAGPPEDRYAALVPGGPHVIISGGAFGVDSAAETAARANGLEVVVHRPKWNVNGVYNPRAGFERNQVIVDDCDMVIAFWDGKSRGTKDTMERARRAGKTVLCTRPF